MDAYRNDTEYTGMTSIGIARGALARIRDGSGVLLRVECGGVWITQSGSGDDVCLEVNQSFRIERDGLTLVSPFGAAPLALVTVEPAPSATRTLAERIAAAFWRVWTGLYCAPARPSTGWI